MVSLQRWLDGNDFSKHHWYQCFLIVFQPINHHNWFFYSLTIDIGGLFNCFHKSRFLLQFWSFNSFCWLNTFGATIEWLRTIVEDTMIICLSYSLLLHYIFGSWIMGAPSHLAFVSILLASVQRYNVTPSCMTYTLTQYLQQWYVTILLAHHWSSTPRLNLDVSFRTLFSNFGQLTTWGSRCRFPISKLQLFLLKRSHASREGRHWQKTVKFLLFLWGCCQEMSE